MQHVDVNIAGHSRTGVIERHTGDFSRLADLRLRVDLLRQGIAPVGIYRQCVSCTCTVANRHERGGGNGLGGEILDIGPQARFIEVSTTGTNFHGIVRRRRKPRKHVRVRGHGDGIGLVPIHADLPFGSCSVLGPAQRGRILVNM